MQPYMTIEPERGATYSHDGEYAVYQYSEYEEWSVLAGQDKRSFIAGGYSSPEAAYADYPEAEMCEGSGYVEPYIPQQAPAWFDRDDAGETWHEDDAY